MVFCAQSRATSLKRHRVTPTAAAIVGAALIVSACSSEGSPAVDAAPADPFGEITSVATTTPVMPEVRPFVDTPCVAFEHVSETGTVVDPELFELSGIAAVPQQDNAYVVHNDSGDAAQLYVIDDAGKTLATWQVVGARAADWEDISIGPTAAGEPAIFIGDIGDNFQFRVSITIYRVPIPALSDTETAPVEFITLTYPDERADAEALAVDPVTGDMFVITKTRDGPGSVYRASADSFADGAEVMLEKVADLALGEDHIEVTSAAISPTGDLFVLRGYNSVWMWPRTDLDWGSVLNSAPCNAASPDELQGEAITFANSGDRLITVSEGTNHPISTIGTHE